MALHNAHGKRYFNNTPSFQNDKRCTPQQLFSVTDVNINPKHWQPFGCPTAVLANPLATSGIYHKWKPRSRVGIYLGHSPQHSRNVALVLDLQTGLVSPQFHVKHDPSFHVVKQEELKRDFESKWQIKAGFIHQTGRDNRKDETKKNTHSVIPTNNTLQEELGKQFKNSRHQAGSHKQRQLQFGKYKQVQKSGQPTEKNDTPIPADPNL